MEEIDVRRTGTRGEPTLRVQQRGMVALIVLVAAVWMLAAVVRGTGLVEPGTGPAPQVTVAPAAGAPDA